MNLKRLAISLVLMLTLIVPVTIAQDDDPGVLNIYSARHYGAMEAPFVAFQEATGIEVRVSQGSPRDLLQRLQADIDRGGRSVADVFLAIDAGVMGIATENGLLQPVMSDVLDTNVPAEYRDPEGHWFGLSMRSRTLVYNPENVTEEEIDAVNTYADLASDVWADRMCMRPASHIYTVSLVSGLIYHNGYDSAKEIVDGWVSNNPIFINSDTRQIQAVMAGECDVAVVNSYYVARLRDAEDPAGAVAHKWMNQGEDDFGVFFNVNAAGIVTNAANYDNALLFIEFMSSLEGQAGTPEGFPGSNFEFPVNPEAEAHPLLVDLGEVTFDTEYSLWEYGSLQTDAVTLLEEAGYGFDES